MQIEHSTDSNGNIVLRIPRSLAILLLDITAGSDAHVIDKLRVALGAELLPHASAQAEINAHLDRGGCLGCAVGTCLCGRGSL